MGEDYSYKTSEIGEDINVEKAVITAFTQLTTSPDQLVQASATSILPFIEAGSIAIDVTRRPVEGRLTNNIYSDTDISSLTNLSLTDPKITLRINLPLLIAAKKDSALLYRDTVKMLEYDLAFTGVVLYLLTHTPITKDSPLLKNSTAVFEIALKAQRDHLDSETKEIPEYFFGTKGDPRKKLIDSYEQAIINEIENTLFLTDCTYNDVLNAANTMDDKRYFFALKVALNEDDNAILIPFVKIKYFLSRVTCDTILEALMESAKKKLLYEIIQEVTNKNENARLSKIYWEEGKRDNYTLLTNELLNPLKKKVVLLYKSFNSKDRAEISARHILNKLFPLLGY